jgi:hypothetical protein
VSKLHAAGRDRSILWQFIDETRAMGSQLCKLEFFKISREQNNLAHELAQFAISFKDCQCFFLLVFQSGLYPSLVRILFNF